MNPPPRLEIVEIALEGVGTIRVPAATAEQASAFAPPAGLRWVELELVSTKSTEVLTIHVLAQA